MYTEKRLPRLFPKSQEGGSGKWLVFARFALFPWFFPTDCLPLGGRNLR